MTHAKAHNGLLHLYDRGWQYECGIIPRHHDYAIGFSDNRSLGGVIVALTNIGYVLWHCSKALDELENKNAFNQAYERSIKKLRGY